MAITSTAGPLEWIYSSSFDWQNTAKHASKAASSRDEMRNSPAVGAETIQIINRRNDAIMSATRKETVSTIQSSARRQGGNRFFRHTLKTIQFLLPALAVGLSVQGCATRNVNPPKARAHTGYVDFHADASAELCWEVSRWDDRSKDFELVFWDLDPPVGGILRLAFAPGHHRLRIALLNQVITKPVEVEVEVQDGKILPARLTLTEAGTTVVETKSQERGGTAFGRYGRRTKFGSEEMVRYDISVTAAAPVAYQRREQMPYAR
jgi:hypothetical protein